MGRRNALWILVGLVLASCNPSQVDPGADVTIAGSVERQDGSAVSGVQVGLMKEASAGDVFLGVVSVGLTCLEGDLSACGETRVTSTGGDGAFSYDLEGRDTQTVGGQAAIMELASLLDRAEGELAGPGVNTRFQVQAEEVQVPLRAWEPQLGLEAAGATVRATWSDPPAEVFPSAADIGDLTRRIEFRVGENEGVWRSTPTSAGTELDARILEDTRGSFAVYSEIDDIAAPPEAGTDVEVLLRSARLPYASQAGPPPSRGKPCSVPGAAGELVAQTSCAVTDGGFSRELRPVTCPAADEACVEPDHTQVIIDLGSSMDVAFVVIRGCDGLCTVDASQDQQSWSAVGSAREEGDLRDVALPVSNPVPGRYLRVSAANGIEALREVSVWDPTPVSVSGSMITTPSDVPDAALPQRGSEDGSGRGGLIALLAAALVIGALIALVVVRRRRT